MQEMSQQEKAGFVQSITTVSENLKAMLGAAAESKQVSARGMRVGRQILFQIDEMLERFRQLSDEEPTDRAIYEAVFELGLRQKQLEAADLYFRRPFCFCRPNGEILQEKTNIFTPLDPYKAHWDRYRRAEGVELNRSERLFHSIQKIPELTWLALGLTGTSIATLAVAFDYAVFCCLLVPYTMYVTPLLFSIEPAVAIINIMLVSGLFYSFISADGVALWRQPGAVLRANAEKCYLLDLSRRFSNLWYEKYERPEAREIRRLGQRDLRPLDREAAAGMLSAIPEGIKLTDGGDDGIDQEKIPGDTPAVFLIRSNGSFYTAVKPSNYNEMLRTLGKLLPLGGSARSANPNRLGDVILITGKALQTYLERNSKDQVAIDIRTVSVTKLKPVSPSHSIVENKRQSPVKERKEGVEAKGVDPLLPRMDIQIEMAEINSTHSTLRQRTSHSRSLGSEVSQRPVQVSTSSVGHFQLQKQHPMLAPPLSANTSEVSDSEPLSARIGKTDQQQSLAQPR